MLLGTYRRKIRDGRITVPAELRRFLSDDLVVLAHPDGYLCLAAEDSLDDVMRDYFGGGGDDPIVRRHVGARTMCVLLDSNGSLRIPPGMRYLVEDGSGEVVFVGVFTCIELWSASAWKGLEDGFAPGEWLA